MSGGIKSITVKVGDDVYKVTREAEGLRAFIGVGCPKCKAKGPTYIGGKGMHIASHDTYQSEGFALCCMAPLGTITAVVSTLFGLEEDEAVLLRGRARVY